MIHRLVHALRLLAAPAADAPASATPPEDVLDRLAGDYADALMLVTDCPQIRLTAEQHAALERVDDALNGARAADAIAWQRVRQCARAALAALARSEGS